MCSCGDYNAQSWSHAQVPHSFPAQGPGLFMMLLARLITAIWVWAVPRHPVLIPARIREVVCHRAASSYIDHNEWFGGVRQNLVRMVTTPAHQLYWATFGLLLHGLRNPAWAFQRWY